MQISHESIYRFIYHRANGGDHRWRTLLPQARRRRGKRRKGGFPAMNSFVDYVSIDQRPADVAARIAPGHRPRNWEADLMAFRQNSQFILVAPERTSRKALIRRQPDKTGRSVANPSPEPCENSPKPYASRSPAIMDPSSLSTIQSTPHSVAAATSVTPEALGKKAASKIPSDASDASCHDIPTPLQRWCLSPRRHRPCLIHLQLCRDGQVCLQGVDQLLLPDIPHV